MRLAFIKSLNADEKLVEYTNAIRVSLFTPICEKWEPSKKDIENKVRDFFRLVDKKIVRELDSSFKVYNGESKDFVWVLTHTRHNTIHLDTNTILPEADGAVSLKHGEKPPTMMTGFRVYVRKEDRNYSITFHKSTDKVIDLLIKSFASYLTNKFSSH
ncbi:MAG: hypothetical protein E3J91_01465 [Hadesarchaea archaeon]|nr:MAG: hypothetical protein E3J91_01465 [Hadesarchaea archaeon]